MKGLLELRWHWIANDTKIRIGRCRDAPTVVVLMFHQVCLSLELQQTRDELQWVAQLPIAVPILLGAGFGFDDWDLDNFEMF